MLIITLFIAGLALVFWLLGKRAVVSDWLLAQAAATARPWLKIVAGLWLFALLLVRLACLGLLLYSCGLLIFGLLFALGGPMQF